MTTHVNGVTASAASNFLATLADQTRLGQSEHWHAGGAFPDILIDLRREGHISDDLYVAGVTFINDLTRYHGTSAGLTSRYGDQVDSGRSERLPPNRIAEMDAFSRIDRVLDQLWGHEHRVLQFCVLAKEAKRGTLADFGRQNSTFKTRQQSRAFAIALIQSLLRSIHAAYRLKIPITS